MVEAYDSTGKVNPNASENGSAEAPRKHIATLAVCVGQEVCAEEFVLHHGGARPRPLRPDEQEDALLGTEEYCLPTGHNCVACSHASEAQVPCMALVLKIAQTAVQKTIHV